MWVPKSGMPLAEPRQNVGHFNVCFLVRGTRPSVSRGDGESGRGTLGRPPLLGVGRDRPFPVGMASQGVGHLGALALFPYETLLLGATCANNSSALLCHLASHALRSSALLGALHWLNRACAHLSRHFVSGSVSRPRQHVARPEACSARPIQFSSAHAPKPLVLRMSKRLLARAGRRIFYFKIHSKF